MIAVFYDRRMSADSEAYSPSASKPEKVVADWQSRGLPATVRSFDASPRVAFYLAHDPAYVRGVLDLSISNGHGNHSPRVAKTFPWTVGSHYAAAMHAIQHGVACSPTSGFHHAGYDFGEGFCTFNGLMVTAMRLINEGVIGNASVGIADYDFHYGNGTDDIIYRLEVEDRVRQVNAGGYQSADKFLSSIEDDLDSLGDIGILLYQAGADMFIGDPLGGLLTVDGLRDRDAIVFEWARKRGVPVVWNLAGGYTRDEDGEIPIVLEIHRNTLMECGRVFSKGEAGDDQGGLMDQLSRLW